MQFAPDWRRRHRHGDHRPRRLHHRQARPRRHEADRARRWRHRGGGTIEDRGGLQGCAGGVGERTENRRLLVFAEPARDKRFDRVESRFRLSSARRNGDRRTHRGAERQNAHDRIAADCLAATRNSDLGVETIDALYEFRRRSGVQALAIDDEHLTCAGAGELRRRRAIVVAGRLTVRLAHLPANTLLATVMYLRPASRASPTACSRSAVSRTEASLISIGRLIPQITSTRPPSMTEIARLEGVPPNMSVSKTTPRPS